ncbi:uncharacterized protein G2W53_011815 [Senna tora]|uniref:Uncharacterized protein n=1 Tax=Senna tora TaxID=362788 RepID=A0A834TY99_9FABA|nr:uncharacterized protein G2W53_011815 [Senna tora]
MGYGIVECLRNLCLAQGKLRNPGRHYAKEGEEKILRLRARSVTPQKPFLICHQSQQAATAGEATMLC